MPRLRLSLVAASNGPAPWHSRTGHHITVYDTSDNKIEIVTKGGHTVTLDDANSEIKVTR